MNTDRLRIELTQEQQDQIKRASGKELQAIELNVEELEQRVAPVVYLKYNMENVIITG
ncbi:MAG TPA: hypothetical protein VJN70_14545 [Gemmatimonadaceae bacterium]|nr:hypothetical protein [Gemmatimonadaceae bacterium]